MYRYFTTITMLNNRYHSTKPLTNVKLFSKKHCGLCEEVLNDLMIIKKEIPFELQIVDIEDRENLNWKKLYVYDIPVVHINDQPFVKWGLDVDDFKAELRQLASQD